MKIGTVTVVYLVILLLGTVVPFGNKLSHTLSNNYVMQIRWDYLVHVILYLPMPVLLGLVFLKRGGDALSGGTTSASATSASATSASATSASATSASATSASGGASVLSTPLYWLLVVGGSLLLTFLYEALQLVIPYRYFNINDIVSNVVGVSAGLILLVAFPSALRRLQAMLLRG